MVDAVLRPWPQSPRRCEETANNQTAQRRGEQTDPGMDQNHRKGIYGDAITQKKDDNKKWRPFCLFAEILIELRDFAENIIR